MTKLHELEDILEVCSTYLTQPESINVIKEAYYYMESKHEGQFRKSGEPYKYHLIEVAYTLATSSPNFSSISSNEVLVSSTVSCNNPAAIVVGPTLNVASV